MIRVHLLSDETYTLSPIDGTVSWDSYGDKSIQISVRQTALSDKIYRDSSIREIVAIRHGKVVWRGSCVSVAQNREKGTIDIVGEGLINKLSKIDDYSEFWSYRGVDSFYQLSLLNSKYRVFSGEFAYQNVPPFDGFTMDTDDSAVTFGMRKDAAFPSLSGYTAYMGITRPSQNTFNYAFGRVSYALPTNFTVSYQTIDTSQTLANTLSKVGDNAPHEFIIASHPQPDVNVITLAGRNATGGTYTNTAEDGYYFASLDNHRLLAHANDTISGTITAAVSPGISVALSTSAAPNIRIGDKIYFTASGEVADVKAATNSTIYADLRFGHAANESFFVPRMHAYNIIEDLARRVGLRAVYADLPDIDIPDSWYFGQNAREILDGIIDTYLYDYRVFATDDMLIIQHKDSVQTYYAHVDLNLIEKTFDGVIYSARAKYTTEFNDDRMTDSYINPIAERQGAIKSIVVDSSYTTSGAALYDAQRYTLRNSKIGIKTDLVVSKLYNADGGEVVHPDLGSKIVLRSIVPEMYGIQPYEYYIRDISANLVTGETEYTLGEYVNSFAYILAK